MIKTEKAMASGHVPRGDLHAVPAYAILVDVDAEARALDAVGVTFIGADRLRGHVLGEPTMRQRQPPGDVGDDGGDVQRCRAGDAGFASLAGDIDAHAEAVAQLAGLDHRPDAAELDCLQADAARGLALVMAGDVGERMDTFVGADCDLGRGRGDRRHAGEIIGHNRLLEESEAAAFHRAHIGDGLLGVIGGGDLEGDLRDAEKKKAAGITAYKIKVGIGTAANDAARTRAICKLLGPGLLISADANQGYTTEQAIDYVRAVKGCGLDFFEQPVVADDLAGMAAVAAAAPEIAIGADEGIHSLADIARHHERKAARGVSLKAIKLGGIRAVVEAGKLCDSLGMSVNISCKTGESSIACAAALHVASVIPNIAWGLTLTHSGLAEDVTAHPIRTDKGHADSIERPGLGIDVDEDRVRRHRVQIATRNVA